MDAPPRLAGSRPARPRLPLLDLPRLDGHLLNDEGTRTDAAQDFGHLVHHRPAAVLRPGSVDDVVAMMRLCSAHGVPVAARGSGHSTSGQAQCADGLVIDTEPLSSVRLVDSATVTAGAGARWSEVLTATMPQGLMPPVLPDYLELSVGGTLSVGGFGGQSHRHGALVDNVTELQVVTGGGRLLTCSARNRPDLFAAVLGGLGQCGVIVSATLSLVRAPATVRRYRLPYSDLRVFLADQRRCVAERRFAYVQGQVIPDDATTFRRYVLEAVAYGPPVGSAPHDGRLTSDLRYDSEDAEITDLGFVEFADRLADSVAELADAGVWDHPHPWVNLLLPSRSVVRYVEQVLADLAPDDLGPGGVILLYPVRPGTTHAAMLRIPDDPMPYLFALLDTAPPDDPVARDVLLAANRRWYEEARLLGGVHYPVGSVPLIPADWRAHFGEDWPTLVAARRRYDPRGILTPGQGIFPPG